MLNHIPLWCLSFFLACVCVCVCVCVPPTDDMDGEHQSILLRMAYLVDLHKIPPGLVLSRNQSCMLPFPRCGKRCCARKAQEVPGIGEVRNCTRT